MTLLRFIASLLVKQLTHVLRNDSCDRKV